MNIKSDFTNLILAVVAVTSILGPVISSVVNSITQIKLQKNELTYNKKVEAYQSWCEHASSFIRSELHSQDTMYFEFLKNAQSAAFLATPETFNAMTAFSLECERIVMSLEPAYNSRETLILLFNQTIQYMNKEVVKKGLFQELREKVFQK